EAAVVVSMPTDQNVLARRLYHFIDDEPNQGPGPGRRSVPDSVGQDDVTGSVVNRSSVQALDRFGKSPRRVFSDIHDRKTAVPGVSDRIFCPSQKVIHRPVFDVLPDHARAEECRGIDRDAGLFGDLQYRIDVLNRSSGRTIWPD